MRFRVKAIDSGHAVSVCEVDATDEFDARRQVTDRGLKVLSIGRQLQVSFGTRNRFPLVVFSQELCALLDAGLTLVEAINTLTEKEHNSATRRMLEQVRQRLYDGRTLSSALEELPDAFPTLYVSSVRASEKSGSIREAILRFVSYQKKIDELKKRIVSASIYPAVLCGAGFLVTLFLVGFVVPRFSSIYEDLGNSIPAASGWLMKWGQLLQDRGWLVALVALGLTGTLGYVFSRQTVRATVFNAIVRIPSLGRYFFTYQLARLYRTVGMLICGGTPAISALRMSTGLLSDSLQPRLRAAIRQVAEGKSLAHSLESEDLTTAVAARMLRVGERSGNMGEMMERIAEFYDEELDRAVDVLTRLIEPVLMLVIGLVIGAIVVLMYFPIFELAGSIQ